jgi:hypothetical protein
VLETYYNGKTVLPALEVLMCVFIPPNYDQQSFWNWKEISFCNYHPACLTKSVYCITNKLQFPSSLLNFFENQGFGHHQMIL